MDLRRVALVTGGAGALGRGIGARLQKDGYQIVLADINASACDDAANDIGGDTFGVQMDVTSAPSVESAVDRILDRVGRIDILVNNAGVLVKDDHASMDEETFDRIVRVNLKGPFLVTRAVIPAMKKQRYGRLIAITSRNKLSGGMPAYAASKAGLDALTVAWARELGDWNITANAVAPGSIKVTPGLDILNRSPEQQLASNRLAISRTPIQRLATREDIAGAVAYFASEEAGFVTGETLFVAGGFQLAPASRYASDSE
ncbi:SDR family NAD(P)-dependent oxidoreductase [Paraburkholderia oxyphila]|uniref:SDR family NAD(P)-dependent oxidoreductase n=1 Tax=Paraburkholderia oxyphila TaxID=614212 RepID=UPI000488B35E|nr:SDR family oxidoreductase [Paraburkholderia oxyphila]